MSITWWNCDRILPVSVIVLGHETIMLLRVPPRCEATCLVHWNGVSPAHAQPTA